MVNIFNYFLSENVAYVDFTKGLNGTCGAEQFPCKHLYDAVEIVDINGRIFIKGEQSLSRTITINKSISIGCLGGSDNAVISNEGKTIFAFQMFNRINITLTGIDFKNILIVKMYKNSYVIIDNCTVSGTLPFFARYDRTLFKLKKGISLQVLNSNFTITGEYLIFHGDLNYDYTWEMRIMFRNCSVTNMNGIHIYSKSKIYLTVYRCTFHSVDCPTIYIKANAFTTEISSSNISESVFTKCTGESFNGGFIRLFYLKSSNIQYCIFRNGTSYEGGAIYINDVIYSNIHGCMFLNNTTSLDGGSIFVKNVKSSTINGCLFTSNTAPRGGSVFIEKSTFSRQ